MSATAKPGAPWEGARAEGTGMPGLGAAGAWMSLRPVC